MRSLFVLLTGFALLVCVADSEAIHKRGQPGRKPAPTKGRVRINPAKAFPMLLKVGITAAHPATNGSGVTLDLVASGSNADVIGLETGDQIVAVDGFPITNLGDLQTALAKDSQSGGGSGMASLTVVDGRTGAQESLTLPVP